MVDSPKLEDVKKEYDLFKLEAINDSYCFDIFYYFDQALKNTEEGHHEIAMFLFCVIIESIVSTIKYEKYLSFDEWLL